MMSLAFMATPQRSAAPVGGGGGRAASHAAVPAEPFARSLSKATRPRQATQENAAAPTSAATRRDRPGQTDDSRGPDDVGKSAKAIAEAWDKRPASDADTDEAQRPIDDAKQPRGEAPAALTTDAESIDDAEAGAAARAGEVLATDAQAALPATPPPTASSTVDTFAPAAPAPPAEASIPGAASPAAEQSANPETLPTKVASPLATTVPEPEPARAAPRPGDALQPIRPQPTPAPDAVAPTPAATTSGDGGAATDVDDGGGPTGHGSQSGAAPHVESASSSAAGARAFALDMAGPTPAAAPSHADGPVTAAPPAHAGATPAAQPSTATASGVATSAFASGDPTGADVDQVNAARVARGLHNAVQQGGGSMTLRLTPADLGTVRIEMQLSGAAVSARFHAESETARLMLTQRIAELRHALEGQGLSVERLSVHSMPTGSAAGGQPGAQGQPQPQADGGAHDGRSRGFMAHDQRRDGGGADTGRRRPRAFDEMFPEPGGVTARAD